MGVDVFENGMHPRELDWLLEPLTVECFRRDYLEVRSLHLSGRAPDRYASLFSLTDAEQILWSHEAQLARSVILLKNGERIFPVAVGPGGLRSWVNAHYVDGATVLLPAVGRFLPSIARFQRSVLGFVGGTVIVNAYLTPPNAQGFEPHFDPHDIFVLQIAGSKRWRIFDPVVGLPTPAQARAVAPSELAHPVATPLLNAGDLLYLPRGFVHEARTQDEASIHLTVGFEAPTWADVIEECVRGATDSLLALRRSVLATPEPEQVLAELFEALQSLGKRDDLIANALEHIRATSFASLEPLPQSEFGGSNPLRVRSADDIVERVPGMLAQVFALETSVRITFPGLGLAHQGTRVPLALTEPMFLEPALRFIANADTPFRVRDLPVEVSDETKVLFVRRLVTSGLLQSATGTS
jgi:ribosomal protein L16 Arg81 hydroxylase